MGFTTGLRDVYLTTMIAKEEFTWQNADKISMKS